MGQIQSRTSTPQLPSFNDEMNAADIRKGLEYVSRDLRRKQLHVHLIVGGDALPCLLFKIQPTCTTLSILQVSNPSPKTLSVLARSVQRAQRLFNLSSNWVTTTTLEKEIPSNLRDTVVHRSLLQADIVYSSEGLTLLALDHSYQLKSALNKLSRGSWDANLDATVAVLRRLVYVSRGRPMTRGYIQQCYPCLEISDNVLLRLGAEYEARFGHRGVVGVNDEYIGWRHDGLMWSAELEEYGRELAFSLGRSNGGESSRWEDKPLPNPPFGEGDTSIADIFAEKRSSTSSMYRDGYF